MTDTSRARWLFDRGLLRQAPGIVQTANGWTAGLLEALSPAFAASGDYATVTGLGPSWFVPFIAHTPSHVVDALLLRIEASLPPGSWGSAERVIPASVGVALSNSELSSVRRIGLWMLAGRDGPEPVALSPEGRSAIDASRFLSRAEVLRDDSSLIEAVFCAQDATPLDAARWTVKMYREILEEI